MAKQMERIIATYKHVAQRSGPISGNILKAYGDFVNVSSTWSQRNIERKGNVSSEMIQVVNLGSRDVNTLTSTDVSSEILTSYSPSCNYRGLFRDIPASGKSPKKQHLEVWQKNKLCKVFDLTNIDVHGDVCADVEFSSFQWSPCETKILYVAEKKQPKSEAFLPKKSDKHDDEVKKGCEYEFVEEWGEQLVGKSSPLWCVCDLQTNLITAMAGGGMPNDVSIGQAVWAPDGGIVGVAYNTHPRRLGLIYCSNRDSFIFHLSPDSVFRRLSKEKLSVKSPKFSPSGSKLVWLERPFGGPHNACFRLISYDWASGESSVLIEIVQEEAKISRGLPFYGIYSTDLGKCWSSDNTLVFSTPQRASIKTFTVNLDTKEINCLSDDNEDGYDLNLLDVKNDLVLCSRASMDSSPSLLLGRIAASGRPEWITLLEQEPLISNVEVGVLRFDSKTPSDLCNKFSAIYMVPKDISNGGFIVWSHGGPHSLFTNGSNILAAFFASLGFGMVLVNYRGSTGAGQASIDSLLGHLGEVDGSDIQQAAEEVLKMFPAQLSPDKCLLFGGSYGGYLSVLLSAQFPTKYKSCVALNPVVDLTSFSVSDIPDWGLVGAGFEYSPTVQITTEIFDKLKAFSPSYKVSEVTAPTLLLLGKKDLRVPIHQGLNYYHQLKALGIKTRALVYDDNHSLSQLPHEIDFAINTALWFMDCLNGPED